MGQDRVENAVMTVPLETDFDLSDDGLADSLKQALAHSVAEAMAAGGEPARIHVLRVGSAVVIRVHLRDPLPDGSEVRESVRRYCVPCRTMDCEEHAALA